MTKVRSEDKLIDILLDTPEKKAKLHVYLTFGMIITWIMIVIGFILFVLIVTGIIQV